MREIKFRGKRIDTGEWVYGSFLIYDPESSDPICQIVTGLGLWYLVYHQTVGQYTRLKDCEGREIYEGDILDRKIYPNDEWSCPARVVWSDEEAAFFLDGDLITGYTFVRIVGNVYDNPKLWENG